MDTALRATQRSRTMAWVCKQCRCASTQAGTRYSTKTATRTLAEDALRSLASGSKPRAPRAEQPSTQIEPRPEPLPNRAPSIMDMLTARASTAPQEEGTISGKDIADSIMRKFELGDVYSPHDISWVEQRKWSKSIAPPRVKMDIVDKLGINYLNEYKNISMMQEFTTSNGRILPGTKTGLRTKNQRKLSKAIRRAQGIGMIPRTYKHPEFLVTQLRPY